MVLQSSHFSEGNSGPQGAELPDFLDGVDVQEGLANMDGSRSLYLRILVNMLRRCCQFEHQLDAARDRGDTDEVKRMFHTLKGLAGSIGARELRKSAEDVERAMAENGLQVPDALMRSFKKSLGRVIHSLSELDGENMLDQGASDRSGGKLDEKVTGAAHLEASFKALEWAIQEGDGDVMRKLSAFGNFLGEWRDSPIFQDLVQQVDDYDFDLAGPTLRRLWSSVHGVT
ncbi:MAG: Hpt domain-containing protein [Magnetococcus sp. THC-1_WYH]